jgi:hypothetical protein
LERTGDYRSHGTTWPPKYNIVVPSKENGASA